MARSVSLRFNQLSGEGEDVLRDLTCVYALPTTRRGLKFTCQGLRSSLSNPSEELSVSFTTAYNNTLKQYHSFLIRPVFAVRPSASLSVFSPWH